jgi:pantoate--beta-alanine ligase
MEVFDKKTDLIAVLADRRTSKKKIGFVPTMGALHQGHLSLVEACHKENDVVVVSIFVNPTQFNNPDDLRNYPRTIETDKTFLQKARTDLLFIPSVEEIYPAVDTENEMYDFGLLEQVMEGKHRPGHFKGVAQVVSKLFKIVNPDVAYFGEKDFQQLVIIRELVKKMNSSIRITGCATVRESDGLAMSSRNTLLAPQERKEASMISQALFYIRDHWIQSASKELRQKAIGMIEHSGMMKVEYLEVADESLQPADEKAATKPLRCFTAVKIGKVRLIDNVLLT